MKLEVMVSLMVTVSVCVFGPCGGWLFSDEDQPRPLDGTLRCYQCNSSESREMQPVCTLDNWKHANVTEKRNMMMQCPRRKSAFCHLVVTEGAVDTVRGCSGPTYSSGRPAHVGCFSMSDPAGAWVKRVCLCDTNLCNRREPLRPRPPLALLALAFHVSCMSL